MGGKEWREAWSVQRRWLGPVTFVGSLMRRLIAEDIPPIGDCNPPVVFGISAAAGCDNRTSLTVTLKFAFLITCWVLSSGLRKINAIFGVRFLSVKIVMRLCSVQAKPFSTPNFLDRSNCLQEVDSWWYLLFYWKSDFRFRIVCFDNSKVHIWIKEQSDVLSFWYS